MLFCGQQSPQLVVDELMSECAQLINEEEPCPSATGHQRKLSTVSTFHAQVRLLSSWAEMMSLQSRLLIHRLADAVSLPYQPIV